MITAQTTPSPTLIGELMAKNADVMIEALGLDQTLEGIANEITSLEAGIHTQQNVSAGLTQQVNTLVAKTDSNAAAIQQEATARTTADGALAQQINTVAVKVDQAYGAVQTKAEVSTVNGIAGQVATIQAKYTVQTDVNGYVQGFGLLNTGSPATSGMAFNVNNFYVTNTLNGTKHHPFMIEGNKVYADNLYVRQANIEKLNVMDVAVNDEIKSSNFVTGSSGWRITKNGDAEFNTVRVRVNARDIVGSLIISKTSGQTTGYSIDGGHGCATGLYIDTQHLSGKLLSVTVIVTATGHNHSYDYFYNVGVVAEGYVQGSKVCRAVNTSGYELSVTAAGTGYVYGGGTIVVSGLSHDHFYPLSGFTVNVTAIVASA